MKRNRSFNNDQKLLLVKSLHTLIWMFFVMAIGYVVYAGLRNRIDALVWYAIGLVVLEGIVLLAFNGSCPLTPVAARFTTSRDDNFDIFLPKWLAKNNKAIFTTIFVCGVAMVIYRVVQ